MNERKESTTSIILEYVRVIVLKSERCEGGIATFIFLQFVQISRVNGSSMENTYFQNNIVLIDKVFYKHSQPKRNDIIIVDYDDGLDDTLIIKRVIAVGGDHLDIKNNEVYIDRIKRYIVDEQICKMDVDLYIRQYPDRTYRSIYEMGLYEFFV